MLAAELHNAQRIATYAAQANPKAPPPQMLTESHFLPRRVEAKPVADPSHTNHRKLANVMNSLCGF